MQNKLLTRHIFPTVIIAGVVFWAFNKLTLAFFLQDEWWTFGRIIFSEHRGILQYLEHNLLTAGKVHAVPVSAAIPFFQYKLFGVDFSGYAATSLIVHFASSITVYYFSLFLLRRNVLAMLIALLFASNSVSYQAVTWVAAINTQIVVLFSLLCLLFFLLFIQSQPTGKFLFVSFIFLLLALLSNESAFTLFIILPTFWFVLNQQPRKEVIHKLILPLFLLGLLYLGFRIPLWFIAKPIVLGETQLLTQPTLDVFLFRLVALPFRILAQSILPESIHLNLSDFIIRFGYPQFITSDNVSNPFIRESIVYDLVSLITAILLLMLLLLSYLYFRKRNNKQIYQSITIALSLTILSGTMLVFIPGRAGFVSLFEPKHLYLANAGSSMLIVLVIYAIASIIGKKKGTAIALLLFIPLLLLHVFKIQSDINKLIDVGNLRKSFLTKVKKNHPNLTNPTVFYLKSDKVYYGMPVTETNLPIQSGFGRMIMIWYQKQEQFPGCLYADLFLHDLIAQGYRECGGRGFGYYRSYDKLVESIKSNGIPTENVIAYSWISNEQKFTDITYQIQQQLINEFKK
jgi:hypothetical protein